MEYSYSFVIYTSHAIHLEIQIHKHRPLIWLAHV